MFIGPHGQLEQQLVHGKADGHHEPQADILGQRQVSRVRKARGLRAQSPVGERDHRKQQQRGRQRQAIGQAFTQHGGAGPGLADLRIVQDSAEQQGGQAEVQTRPRQRDRGRAGPPRETGGQRERQRIFHKDQPGIALVMKAGAQQGEAIFEGAIGGREGERPEDEGWGGVERLRHGGTGEAGQSDETRQDPEGAVEAGAPFRPGDPHRFGVKTRRGEPQPAKQSELHQPARADGHSKAPEGLGPKKARDNQPDHKIDKQIE